MLCFWLLEPEKFKLHTKNNAEVNATGVVYIPGVCRGLNMPSRTLFGVCYILTSVGIQTLFVCMQGFLRT